MSAGIRDDVIILKLHYGQLRTQGGIQKLTFGPKLLGKCITEQALSHVSAAHPQIKMLM